MTFDLGMMLPTLLIALLGWLLARSIKSVDDKLARLEAKVDLLASQDGEHTSKLVELAVRVYQMERRKEKEQEGSEDDAD